MKSNYQRIMIQPEPSSPFLQSMLGWLANQGIAIHTLILGNMTLCPQTAFTPDDLLQFTILAKKVGLTVVSAVHVDLVTLIKQLIREYITNPSVPTKRLSVFLCEELEMKYDTIYSALSNVEGVSIEKYHCLAMVDYAKELLFNLKYDMQQIAELCGFADHAHFSREFKAQTGMSPSAFRKLYCGENDK